jgi:hypothetical protein
MISFMLQSIIYDLTRNRMKFFLKPDEAIYCCGRLKVKTPTNGRDCLDFFQVYCIKNCIKNKTKCVPERPHPDYFLYAIPSILMVG